MATLSTYRLLSGLLVAHSFLEILVYPAILYLAVGTVVANIRGILMVLHPGSPQVVRTRGWRVNYVGLLKEVRHQFTVDLHHSRFVDTNVRLHCPLGLFDDLVTTNRVIFDYVLWKIYRALQPGL